MFFCRVYITYFQFHENKIIQIAFPYIIVNYKETKIVLNYRESAGNNINHVFNTAKGYKGKIEGAEKAIEETKKLIMKEKQKAGKKKRVKHWFESYHWFTSSAGNMENPV